MNLEEFEKDYYNILYLEKNALYNEQKEIMEQLKQVSEIEKLEKLKWRLKEIQSELSGLDYLDKSLELIRARSKNISEQELKIFRNNEIELLMHKIIETKNIIDNLEDKSEFSLKPYVKKIIEYQENLRLLLPDDLEDIVSKEDSLKSRYFKKRANGKQAMVDLSYILDINEDKYEERIDLFNLYLNLSKEKQQSVYDKFNERNSLRSIIDSSYKIYIPIVVGSGNGTNVNYAPFELNLANSEDIKNRFDKSEEVIKVRVFNDRYLSDKEKGVKIAKLLEKLNNFKEEYVKYYEAIKQKEQEYNSKVKDLDVKIMLDFSHYLNSSNLNELENIVMKAHKLGKSSEDIAIDMSGEIKRMEMTNLINSEAERLSKRFYWNYRNYKVEPSYNLDEAKKLAEEYSYPEVRKYIDETFDFDYYQEHFGRFGI